MPITAPPPIAANEETGRLGVRHLKRFWSLKLADVDGPEPSYEWVAANTLLAGLQLGLQETLHFLFRNRPTFDEFEAWILEKNVGPLDPELVTRLNLAVSEAGIQGQPADPHAEPILSAEDLAFWNQHGFVVVRNAVPPENCEAASKAICDFIGVKRDDPATWYPESMTPTIWVPLLHHPALLANRNSTRIRRAFAQIWNREDVWVTADQSGFNPPETPAWKFPGPHLHFDVSLARPVPFGVQGILYLNDTPAEQGAFTCVPGFHRHIEEWLEKMPPGVEARKVDLSAYAHPVAGQAGDLVIWHQALPHGSSPNRGTQPRIVQYMMYRPSYWGYNATWL